MKNGYSKIANILLVYANIKVSIKGQGDIH